jgi:hypothetical protein
MIQMIRQFVDGQLARLDRDQRGAALTEFAITLPIFLLLLMALLHLANMGQTTVAVKKAAYSNMWSESYRLTQATITEEPGVYSPRSAFMDAMPDGVSASSAIGSLDSIAEGIGGHWGEAMFKTNLAPLLTGGQITHTSQDTEASVRLNENVNITTGPHQVMTEIIGESRQHRPAFAVNDNLGDDNLANHLDGMDGISGVISSALSAGLTASGVVPGLFAGVRSGDAEGTASGSVDFDTNLLAFSDEYSVTYRTGLSPHAGDTSVIPGFDIEFGAFDRENAQWFFYYITGQTVTNKRVSLNLLDIEYDTGEEFHNPSRYQ